MQQAITWANVDPVFCHHMASLGPNELSEINTWLSNYIHGFDMYVGCDYSSMP